MANFGGPFSLNLFGELMLIISLRTVRPSTLIVLTLLSLFSAVYSLTLFRNTSQGFGFNSILVFRQFNLREMVYIKRHV